uniref:Uncharacterized protein n=1 Tax=Pediastrum duplex TaxID=3105 RepID=A0A2U8GIL6_PEDDU|nr:hypothetical protein [Pediastrum duplex]AWI68518.1 hypothetical protein [Pediastrum duplex]
MKPSATSPKAKERSFASSAWLRQSASASARLCRSRRCAPSEDALWRSQAEEPMRGEGCAPNRRTEAKNRRALAKPSRRRRSEGFFRFGGADAKSRRRSKKRGKKKKRKKSEEGRREKQKLVESCSKVKFHSTVKSRSTVKSYSRVRFCMVVQLLKNNLLFFKLILKNNLLFFKLILKNKIFGY